MQYLGEEKRGKKEGQEIDLQEKERQMQKRVSNFGETSKDGEIRSLYIAIHISVNSNCLSKKQEIPVVQLLIAFW